MAGWTQTDASGAYTVVVSAGQYALSFDDASDTYSYGFASGAGFTPDPAGAYWFTVSAPLSVPTVILPLWLSKPLAVTAVGNNRSATVSWTAPSDDGGSAITRYTVTASDGTHTCTWTSGPLTCTVFGLTDGQSYTFTVVADTAYETSVASDPSNAVTPTLGALTPTTFHPVTPVRLLDTRYNNGLSVPLTANIPATFGVTGRVIPGFTTIPDDATAVTGNLTVTNPTAYWAAYIGPAPLASPGASTINFNKGDGMANGVTVALGTGAPGSGPLGTLSATYMGPTGNTTDLVFDVTGYFTPDASGDTYYPVTPVRLLDTRYNNGLSVPLTANIPATFGITGRVIPGFTTIPDDATAVTGNLTVTNPTAYWAAYIGPAPEASPGSSTINFNKGDGRANNVTVALGTGQPGSGPLGTLSATYMGPTGNTTDLVFDVTGYFMHDAGGAKFVPITPVRLLDSRHNNGLSVPIPANSPATFGISGRVVPGYTTIPDTAIAITGNLTVTDQTAYWAAYIGPAPLASPGSSTVNFVKGFTVANGVAVALGTGLPGSGPKGSLSVTYMGPGGNTTNMVFDVTGYFVP
jgi:hypothetical protein